MIFGERFYPMLGKLSPWRQSLFALSLAQRQLPNFLLWCELREQKGTAGIFLKALNELWQFHEDKFNHIDLEELVGSVEPFIPEGDPEELSVGDLFGLDALITFSAACDAVILHEGNEAEIASRTSLGGVVRSVEEKNGPLDDEALRENPLVDAEVNFQVELLELLSHAKRSAELTENLKVIAGNGGVSNIGISYDSDR